MEKKCLQYKSIYFFRNLYLEHGQKLLEIFLYVVYWVIIVTFFMKISDTIFIGSKILKAKEIESQAAWLFS